MAMWRRECQMELPGGEGEREGKYEMERMRGSFGGVLVSGSDGVENPCTLTVPWGVK